MTVALQTVGDDEGGLRLDRWFRRHHPGTTQGVLQKLCRTGQIRIDGRRAQAATRLAPGQAVRIPPLASPLPERDHRVDERDVDALAEMILYEDDALLVLNKPSGLPSQGGPGIVRHVDGMAASLRDARGRRPLLVHRLDRDTSGALLLAKGPSNAARLAALFRSRAITKTYWAVVVGKPVPAEGVIDPLTGRTHQIRVHCEAIGVPILGDPKYGEGRAQMDGFTARLHLHARALTLPHPEGGTLAVHAPLPSHMRETFRQLGFTVPRDQPHSRT